ncbi:CopG family ribbon-helix-helix protein [Pyrobaculum neutrophilum]|uniref:Transcriptional regulator, CopG family n=1 Tax=Pyrobaculum neutrophilum (strain DSM 2338 / JCM 9278 / NBRC 100436 / V24Sta) TaxID=444157 RepID=B1Y8Y2_PYRNV|nr:CopG family ribbon-helix-helix protein [Pyrobaculum neutrophilum]ACB40211.1 putative transcriptional regulator, CopG family [Pyrobaculum neutrophilum V24Sta]
MKRFGVSLPRDVADKVDRISQEMGVTRSEVVATALQEYLEARRSHAEPGHQCLGVVMALTDAFSEIGDVIEENKAHIVAYTHLHVEGRCLTIAVVKGAADQIEKLTLEVAKRSKISRYVPLL